MAGSHHRGDERRPPRPTIGGAPGLAAAKVTLGLKHTAGGSGDLWGTSIIAVARSRSRR
jgi:hypothetical protein